jgi:hypothetical protein
MEMLVASVIGELECFPGLGHAETQIVSEIGLLYGITSSSKSLDLDIKIRDCGSHPNVRESILLLL